MKLSQKHWLEMLANGDPRPELAKRKPQANGQPNPEVLCARSYVAQVAKTSDFHGVQAWREWGLEEAFLAGMTLQRLREELQPYFAAATAAKLSGDKAAHDAQVRHLLRQYQRSYGDHNPPADTAEMLNLWLVGQFLKDTGIAFIAARESWDGLTHEGEILAWDFFDPTLGFSGSEEVRKRLWSEHKAQQAAQATEAA